MFLASDVVINQHIVGSLKRSALQIMKWSAQRLKGIDIDAVDNLQPAARSNLPDHWTHYLDMRHLVDYIGHLHRNRSAADSR